MWNQRVPDNGILSPTALSSGYSYLYLFYILFHNNTSAINITSQPTNIYFDGLDMVVIRNSFSEGDTFFCYKNNDWTAGHDHFDAGHFEIARDRGLAIDTGAYEGGDSSPNHHDTKYYRRTIAHNTITVYDPNEIWDDYYGRYTTNDGGQKWPGPANGSGHPQRVADLADDSYDRGGIQKFKSTDEYTYFLADLTPAYSRADGSDIAITHSSKMEKFTREILHLDKKYFIVFDKVKSSDVNFTKRWLLHFVNQPTVSGNLITAHNGNSVLYNSTVFPQNHQITVRGGSGQEYWTNYDATGENPTFNTGYFGKFPNEPGSWRAEIEPQNHNQTDYFLNVLAPGPDTLSPPITKAITENNNKMIGVQISGNPGYVILFNTDITGDDVSGTISYTTDTGSENAHYLFGLPAGTRYNADIVNSGETTTVTISPDPNGSYQTTADNLLELPLNSSHMPIIQTVTIE
jgi:heparin/heparan-sulfate lyase